MQKPRFTVVRNPLTRAEAVKRGEIMAKLKDILEDPEIENHDIKEKVAKILATFSRQLNRYDYRLYDEDVQIVPDVVLQACFDHDVGRLGDLLVLPMSTIEGIFRNNAAVPAIIEVLHMAWQKNRPCPVTQKQQWFSVLYPGFTPEHGASETTNT